jgi:hypothetical protein
MIHLSIMSNNREYTTKTYRTCAKVSTGKFDCSMKGTATPPSIWFACGESKVANGIAALVFPAADMSQAGWPVENGPVAWPNAMGARTGALGLVEGKMGGGPFKPLVCAWSVDGLYCGAMRVEEGPELKLLLSSVPRDTGILSLICSWSPGDTDMGGVQENWPDIDALIRCMPMAKSVKPRESRFCAARSLPRTLDFLMEK